MVIERILRPDALVVWSYKEVRECLGWYYRVMINEKPAKFLICKSIKCEEENFSDLTLKELWELHDCLRKEFKKKLEKIKRSEFSPDKLPCSSPNFLDVKVEIAKRMLKKCNFCVRNCGINRERGERGFCGVGKLAVVSSYFHHFGEEAPLLGGGKWPVGGSGTIFFAGCNLRCVFCQNYDISFNPENGVKVNAKQLARIATELRDTGAANINWVGGEPTPNLHIILESMKYIEVNVPMLWNSNMLCSPEAMELLLDVIDIWLPDFKFGNNKCANRLTGGGINYVETVLKNLKIAQENGDMIIRHLVMPNHIECCTKPILEMIAKELDKDRILVNIMGQYRPMHLVNRYPEKYRDIARYPTPEEMEKAYKIAEKLGICFRPVS